MFPYEWGYPPGQNAQLSTDAHSTRTGSRVLCGPGGSTRLPCWARNGNGKILEGPGLGALPEAAAWGPGTGGTQECPGAWPWQHVTEPSQLHGPASLQEPWCFSPSPKDTPDNVLTDLLVDQLSSGQWPVFLMPPHTACLYCFRYHSSKRTKQENTKRAAGSGGPTC